MQLKDLLKDVAPTAIPLKWAKADITGISCDSRTVKPQNIFVALKGHDQNGDKFAADAIGRGAAVIVAADDFNDSSDLSSQVFLLKVKDPQSFLKKILKRFYGDLTAQVKVMGVTGTNGKTTITYLLENILRADGKSSGVIGTINHRIGNRILDSKNTTPGIVENQIYLSMLAQEKIPYCVMEVSSHGLEQGRVDLIDFTTGIFTNLTGDHLDYHKTMDNYFLAKSILFKGLHQNAFAVINVDDAYGRRLTTMTKAKVVSYGLTSKADVYATDINLQLHRTSFVLNAPAGKRKIETTLIGQHNIYNILAAAASCLTQDISLSTIKKGVELLKAVPGRLEQVTCGQDFSVFVDYAHTHDALENVLQSLKKVSRAKIIVVFGCGGNRDKTKRPKMGTVADRLADWTIVTSDNPRNEDPSLIVNEIVEGFTKGNYEVVLDRETAIHKALSLAGRNEVVLIAGKGHEAYQIFKNETIHFDDREVVKNYFASKVLSH